MLTNPLRDRFGIVARLEFYTPTNCRASSRRSAQPAQCAGRPDGALEIAKRSRGTPRIANRLLRRVRDLPSQGLGQITRTSPTCAARCSTSTTAAWTRWTASCSAVIDKFGGGPVGVDNLAAAIGEARATPSRTCWNPT